MQSFTVRWVGIIYDMSISILSINHSMEISQGAERGERAERREFAKRRERPERRERAERRERKGRGHRGKRHVEGQEEAQQTKGLPNLAAHFAALTNSILKRIDESGTIESVYDKFMASSKKKIIIDLKRTYMKLYEFYNDQSMAMPQWLAGSPPIEVFYVHGFDPRLESRVPQAKQDLRAFVEEHGFVCTEVSYTHFCTSFSIYLRLDVARIPSTAAREHVNKTLLNLDANPMWIDC